MRKCPNCGAVSSPGDDCPNCGFEFGKPKTPAPIADRLSQQFVDHLRNCDQGLRDSQKHLIEVVDRQSKDLREARDRESVLWDRLVKSREEVDRLNQILAKRPVPAKSRRKK